MVFQWGAEPDANFLLQIIYDVNLDSEESTNFGLKKEGQIYFGKKFYKWSV